MTLIGYARVSTLEQDEALQVDALAAAGCEPERIHVDHMEQDPAAQEAELTAAGCIHAPRTDLS